MDEYNDIRAFLKPQRDIKASSQLRSRVENAIVSRRRSHGKLSWLWGSLSAAAVAAAIACLILIPGGASANSSHDLLQTTLNTLSSTDAFEMEIDVRTPPNDNFDFIDPDADFVTHHISVERWSDTTSIWRIDKGGRKAVHNEHGTYIWIDPIRCGWYSANKNIVGYLSVFLSPSKILEAEMYLTINDKQAQYSIDKKDGEIMLTVHSMPNGDFSNPYALNHSISESETYRQYVIDDESRKLKSAVVSVVVNGRKVEMIRLKTIKYDARNSEITAIPDDVKFINYDRQNRISGLSDVNAKEATSIILNAFKGWDRDILSKVFDAEMIPAYEQEYSGAEPINIGEPFKSGNNANKTFVPYTLRLRNGRIKSLNLALLLTENNSWIIIGGL